jgi:hypothetical protein
MRNSEERKEKSDFKALSQFLPIKTKEYCKNQESQS